MEEEKISVIIPVYNAEKTIDRCLESACGQTYDNLEIIIVNDGSSDSTIEKLLSWRVKDSRIIVIDQKNQGAAAARNKGIEHITGEYFTFLDADDYIENDIYRKLYSTAVEYNLDIVSASIREIYNGDIIEERINDSDLPILTGIQAACNMLKYEGGIRTVVWDKLYRTEAFRNIRFKNGYVFGEDTLYNFRAMMQCKRYGRISDIGYTYDHRESQVTGKKYSSIKVSNIYVAREIENIYTKMKNQPFFTHENEIFGRELEKSITQFQVTIYRQLFYNMLLAKISIKEIEHDYKLLKAAALEIDKDFVKKYLNKADLVQWYLYLYFPIGFKIIHRIRH